MRIEGLFIALLFTWKPLYEAFYLAERSMDDALLRFGVSAFLASLAAGMLRRLYLTYASHALLRRKTDTLSSTEELLAGLAPQQVKEIGEILKAGRNVTLTGATVKPPGGGKAPVEP